MQTPKASKIGATETPKKVGPRAVRQLKTTALEINPASSSPQACRTSKGRTSKALERRSPRSPVTEHHQKQPNRVSELESQLSQLQEDLKKVEDQLTSSDSCKRQAQQDAEDSKKELLALTLKFEESQKQLHARSASEETDVIELQKSPEQSDHASQSELPAVKKQHSVDSAALASAMNEIHSLKVELETVAKSEATQMKLAESAHTEIQILKADMAESVSVLGNMKSQLEDCKESEAQARAVVSETLMQLEAAKSTIETLKTDGIKAKDDYNSISSELLQSWERINLLEEIVSSTFQADTVSDEAFKVIQKNEHSLHLASELDSMKLEIKKLRSALETAEIRSREEQIQSTLQIKNAYEMVEEIKSATSLRKAELEAELKNSKSEIEVMKASLMDKETELQGIKEENEGLNMKLDNSFSLERERELETRLKESEEDVVDLKAGLMDKETELQNIQEENETLRSGIKKWEINGRHVCDEAVAQAEEAKDAEREAVMKLGLAMEEAEKSRKRADRVNEQLEAAQAVNSEMETELRKMKVQSNQWRKAAEAAATILSAGNNNGMVMDRTASLDSKHNEITAKNTSPCLDYDFPKNKNGNVLKKIGVLWKKPQK